MNRNFRSNIKQNYNKLGVKYFLYLPIESDSFLTLSNSAQNSIVKGLLSGKKSSRSFLIRYIKGWSVSFEYWDLFRDLTIFNRHTTMATIAFQRYKTTLRVKITNICIFLFFKDYHWYTECPKIYRKSVLHLLTYRFKQMQYRFAVNFGTLSQT